jgi:hypothetical protein
MKGRVLVSLSTSLSRVELRTKIPMLSIRYLVSPRTISSAGVTGESSYEPLDVISADDPITCAAYAK